MEEAMGNSIGLPPLAQPAYCYLLGESNIVIASELLRYNESYGGTMKEQYEAQLKEYQMAFYTLYKSVREAQ